MNDIGRKIFWPNCQSVMQMSQQTGILGHFNIKVTCIEKKGFYQVKEFSFTHDKSLCKTCELNGFDGVINLEIVNAWLEFRKLQRGSELLPSIETKNLQFTATDHVTFPGHVFYSPREYSGVCPLYSNRSRLNGKEGRAHIQN